MGRATIKSGGPTGYYTVEILKYVGKSKYDLNYLTNRLYLLDALISTAQANELELKAKLSNAIWSWQQSIYNCDSTKAKTDDMAAKKKVVEALVISSREAAFNFAALKLEKQSKIDQKAAITIALAPETRKVWCTDLTENLKVDTIVGTMEMNGEPDEIIICPGGDKKDALGQLEHIALCSVADIFYNKAIYSCWQKWKPTYRVGTITRIDYGFDLCDVGIANHLSTEDNLPINQKGAVWGTDGVLLSSVPIIYMNGMNSAPFIVGDKVVVAFKDRKWDSPQVIGFETNPRIDKGVIGDYYIFMNKSPNVSVSVLAHLTAGAPIVDTKNGDDILLNNSLDPVSFNLKKFYHNVPVTSISNGKSVVSTSKRDLYFVATSLLLSPNPLVGWTNFAAVNPSFPLVTNNASTQIKETAKVLADLNLVTYNVNHAHVYASDPAGNDNWSLMTGNQSGDCEDFALTKAKALLDMGYPASAMHIEVGIIGGQRAGQRAGHAWLVFQTDKTDWVLDVVTDVLSPNFTFQYGSKEILSRRRQIGMNWANISPFAWLMSSTNTSRVFWYIYDPTLNIFYPIPDSPPYQPFASLIPSITAYTELSGPSINFSADNNLIHVAYNGLIRSFKLAENSLNLVSQSSYTSAGFVGREGTIIQPEGIYGRKDPFDWSDGSVQVFEDGGRWHLANILPARRGAFRCLGDYMITSADGYYIIKYSYLVGEFTVTGNPGYGATVLIDFKDPERPDDVFWHMKTVYSGFNNDMDISGFTW